MRRAGELCAEVPFSLHTFGRKRLKRGSNPGIISVLSPGRRRPVTDGPAAYVSMPGYGGRCTQGCIVGYTRWCIRGCPYPGGVYGGVHTQVVYSLPCYPVVYSLPCYPVYIRPSCYPVYIRPSCYPVSFLHVYGPLSARLWTTFCTF